MTVSNSICKQTIKTSLRNIKFYAICSQDAHTTCKGHECERSRSLWTDKKKLLESRDTRLQPSNKIYVGNVSFH